MWLGASLAQAQEAPGPDAPAPAPQPAARDQVFKIQRNGRQVYTNAGAVQVRGTQAEAIELPALSSDLSAASPAQLQLLDNSVQRAHDDMQQGARCQAIRASLRVPMTTFVLRGHLRELCVGGGMLLFAVILLASWHGRLRSLMPVAPVLACLYLGYATYARVDQRMNTLRDGLRACSSDLPPQAGSVDSLRTRLEEASSLQATIDRAYAQRASVADAMLRER
ncbi:MAG TPA: hypothetical protein VI299_16155 [Polyangiales bacterium]